MNMNEHDEIIEQVNDKHNVEADISEVQVEVEVVETNSRIVDMEKEIAQKQAELDRLKEEFSKVQEDIAYNKSEADRIKSEAKTNKVEADKYVKEQRAKTESERERIIAEARGAAAGIIDEAKATAKSMTDAAQNIVDAYYAGKEAEGESRKEAIISKANKEAEEIIRLANNTAATASNTIKSDADAYDEKIRASADKYAEQIKAQADGLLVQAEKKLTEADNKAEAIRSKADTYAEATRTKAREDAEAIRSAAREEIAQTKAELEEEKKQLNRKNEDVEQRHAATTRYEERLKQREENLDKEVEDRVGQEYCDLIQQLDQVKKAYKQMEERSKTLGDELSKYKAYVKSETEVKQFNDLLKMLEENNLSFNDLSNLLQYKEFSEKLSSENKRLREKIIKLNGEKSELALAQSNSNANEDMLQIEQQKSQYLEKTVKSLFEELSKNQTASRDDMLAPLRQAPAFLNTNGLSLYNDSDEMKWLENIRNKAEGNGLYFTKRQLFAYHTAQKIRGMSPLVVLAGISGTGKSELPKNYALYGGMNFLSIPVKPDWDSPASLFGYYNSIEKRFEASELLRAIYQMGTDLSHKDQMLMVLLDEMNLAHPEQYFADILSKLETSRGYGVAEYDILLGGGEKPEKIAIGSNVLWTGTMNEDETTKGLSDKVIDRSTLITFPRPKELRSRTVSESATQKMEFVLPRSIWNSWLNKKRTDDSGIFQDTIDSYRQAVQNINDNMSKMGRNLGHRVWQGIEDYIRNHPQVIYAKDDELKEAMNMAFVDAVAFKVMPKLRGVEVRGRNEEYFNNIGKELNESARDLTDDFGNARQMTTDLFQWNSAEFMNKEQGKY